MEVNKLLMRESLECPICRDFFNEPKQLECGHTFCGICIEHLDKVPMVGPHRSIEEHYASYGFVLQFSIQCPQCRTSCIIPSAGLSTNYVVKDMVDRFRTIEVSCSDAGLDTTNTANCYICSRKTPVQEMFMCKDCRAENKTTKLFMCSLCAFKLHREHDVIICSDLATAKEREVAANRIAEIFKNSNVLMKAVKFDIERGIHRFQNKVEHKLSHIEILRMECHDAETNPLKNDLETRIEAANQIEGLIKKDVLKMIELTQQLIQLENDPASNFSFLTPSDNPSCSSASLLSPLNLFAYNEHEKKRRAPRKKIGTRRLPGTSTSQNQQREGESPNHNNAQNQIEIGTIVLE